MLVYLGVSLWAVLLANRVYRYDLYHKAPRPMLLLAFVAGFAAMWGLGHLEDHTSDAWGIESDHITGRALIAATHEELGKLAIVVCLALACGRRFKDPMDGLIYGAFVGLGMAAEESLFYLSLRGSLGLEALGIELVRLPLHVLLGGLSAFAVGMAAARMKHWPLALAGWWTASATLHFLWDCWAGLPQAAVAASMVSRLPPVVLATTTITLFGVAVVLGSRWSRARFAPQSPLRLWGWPFTASRERRRRAPSIGPAALAARPD